MVEELRTIEKEKRENDGSLGLHQNEARNLLQQVIRRLWQPDIHVKHDVMRGDAVRDPKIPKRIHRKLGILSRKENLLDECESIREKVSRNESSECRVLCGGNVRYDDDFSMSDALKMHKPSPPKQQLRQKVNSTYCRHKNCCNFESSRRLRNKNIFRQTGLFLITHKITSSRSNCFLHRYRREWTKLAAIARGFIRRIVNERVIQLLELSPFLLLCLLHTEHAFLHDFVCLPFARRSAQSVDFLPFLGCNVVTWRLSWCEKLLVSRVSVHFFGNNGLERCNPLEKSCVQDLRDTQQTRVRNMVRRVVGNSLLPTLLALSFTGVACG